MPRKRSIVRKGELSVHMDQRFGEYCVSWRYLPISKLYTIVLQKGRRLLNHTTAKTKAEAMRKIVRFKRSVKGWKRNIY